MMRAIANCSEAIRSVLLGASLPFVTPGKSRVAGVLGGGMEWRTHDGVSIFGAVEAIHRALC